MKALITGASSGIGRDMAKILSEMGYDIIAVARREDRLLSLCDELSTKVYPLCFDLSNKDECLKLYETVKNEDIDILINNAGFGIFGKFEEIDLNSELQMINVNINALHILCKLFLRDFKLKSKGYILNVASAAAFLPGPLLSSYYATKAYVLRLTLATYEELRRDKSRVYIGALCPGPVKTEFDDVAGVRFSVNGHDSKYVARYGIKKMFEKKLIIIPGFTMKLSRLFSKFVPDKLLLKIVYNLQRRKERN